MLFRADSVAATFDGHRISPYKTRLFSGLCRLSAATRVWCWCWVRIGCWCRIWVWCWCWVRIRSWGRCGLRFSAITGTISGAIASGLMLVVGIAIAAGAAAGVVAGLILAAGIATDASVGKRILLQCRGVDARIVIDPIARAGIRIVFRRLVRLGIRIVLRHGIGDRLHGALHVLTRLGKRIDAWTLTIQHLIGCVDGLLQGGARLLVRHIVLAAVHKALGLFQRGSMTAWRLPRWNRP